MLIARIDGDQVLEIADYRAMFPDVSFPQSGPSNDWLAANSCLPVTVYLPYDQATQVLAPADPYILDGYVYTVVVRNMTPEEQEAYDNSLKAQNKTQATSMLAATDWVDVPAVSDTSLFPHLTNKADFDTYRQALRVIAVTPPVVVDPWPTKPDENWVTQ